LQPEIERVLDDTKWRSYLRSQLSDVETRTLRDGWKRSDTRRLAIAEQASVFEEGERVEWGKTDEDFAWRWWVAQVLRIEVAVLRDSATLQDPFLHYQLEITWRRDATSGELLPTRLAFVAAPGDFVASGITQPATWAGARVDLLGPIPQLGQTVVLDPYLAALRLHIARHKGPDFTRVPKRRPKPGQPPNIDFYRRLSRRHEELKIAGHADPTARLTHEMQQKDPNVTKDAVKQLLRRGRKYLERARATQTGAPPAEQTWRPPRKGETDGKE
jgi:hypothetical protein